MAKRPPRVSRNKLRQETQHEAQEAMTTRSSRARGIRELSEFIPQIKFKPKNEKQKEYCDAIRKEQIVFCLGPAGVGKSAVAIYSALDLLRNPETPYSKIIITRPVVESYEDLGYLPGELDEKIQPYLYPTKVLMDEFIGEANTKTLFENGVIKFQPIAYCRGLNFKNCIVLIEESQNLVMEQFKLLITRIAENCKMIFSGDPAQHDIKKHQVVFDRIATKMADMDEIQTICFDSTHVVRNPIIQRILPVLDIIETEITNPKK